MFKKGAEKIPYSLASSGEKTILDVHMLEKLIPNSGLLIFDEFLKNLDNSMLQTVCELLADMKIGTLILTSHQIVGDFYNKIISLSLDENGLTQIKSNNVLVNGKVVKKSYKLKYGDKVQIDELERYLSPIILDEAEEIDIPIVREEEDYIILNKPK